MQLFQLSVTFERGINITKHKSTSLPGWNTKQFMHDIASCLQLHEKKQLCYGFFFLHNFIYGQFPFISGKTGNVLEGLRCIYCSMVICTIQHLVHILYKAMTSSKTIDKNCNIIPPKHHFGTLNIKISKANIGQCTVGINLCDSRRSWVIVVWV